MTQPTPVADTTPNDAAGVAALFAASQSDDPDIAIAAFDSLLCRAEVIARAVIGRVLEHRRVDARAAEVAILKTICAVAVRVAVCATLTEEDLHAWTRAAALRHAAAAIGRRLEAAARTQGASRGMGADERRILRAAVGAMSHTARHVLLRRAVRGATWTQLGEELCITRDEARRRVSRARAEFRRRLAEMLDAPVSIDTALARAFSRTRAA
jgi:DNA-directed RNA polymerase specialized sigma24 family protein